MSVGDVLDKYFVTVSLQRDGSMAARQVNNVVAAKSGGWKQKLLKSKCRSVNVLNGEVVAKDPVTLILFSSFGAMYGAKMTIRQPSDGMWTLAEIMSRTVPEATCVCIDPNIMSFEKLVDGIADLNVPLKKLIFGFSMLPQNLVNDAEFMMKVKKKFPSSRMLVGGLGSNSLAYLPSCQGKFGVELVLPVDALIPGPAVLELAAVLSAIYKDNDIDKNSLREIVDEESMKYLPEVWQQTQSELNRAYLSSRENFVPLNPGIKRVFYEKSYAEMRGPSKNDRGVVTVLTDNSCKQRCWFCSTPKDRRFEKVEQEFEYIRSVAKLASEISFNNNDLACDVDRTIRLCQLMANDISLSQKKHGKISVSSYDEKLILALKQANFVRIGIGIETFNGNDRAGLKGANFRNTVVVEQTMNKMLEQGIIPEINLILFHPKETKSALKLTTLKTLRWVSKGARVNATVGVNAIPNSYAVLQILKSLKNKRIGTDEINKEMCSKFELSYVDGVKDKLMFPVQWLVLDKELQRIKHSLRKERLEIIKSLPEELLEITNSNYVPVESYIFLVLLAREFGLSGYTSKEMVGEKIAVYIKSFKDEVYVGI